MKLKSILLKLNPFKPKKKGGESPSNKTSVSVNERARENLLIPKPKPKPQQKGSDSAVALKSPEKAKKAQRQSTTLQSIDLNQTSENAAINPLRSDDLNILDMHSVGLDEPSDEPSDDTALGIEPKSNVIKPFANTIISSVLKLSNSKPLRSINVATLEQAVEDGAIIKNSNPSTNSEHPYLITKAAETQLATLERIFHSKLSEAGVSNPHVFELTFKTRFANNSSANGELRIQARKLKPISQIEALYKDENRKKYKSGEINVSIEELQKMGLVNDKGKYTQLFNDLKNQNIIYLGKDKSNQVFIKITAETNIPKQQKPPQLANVGS